MKKFRIPKAFKSALLYKPLLILSIIILIGAFLRFYNFPFRYGLAEESVRDAVIGIEAAREIQLPLTGSFSSLGPFTFGPIYAYQLALATFILRTPYAPWIYLTLISIAYIPVLYKIGKELFDQKFGLVLAFLVAISPAQIISATHLTPHNATNIFAASTILLFLLLLKEKKPLFWSLIFGLLIGTGINLHLQMIGLLIFPLIILIVQKKIKPFALTLFGVFATFLPYLFFELNNHWFNTRNMIYFMLYDRQRISIPSRWLTYTFEFWPGFWGDVLGVPPIFAGILMASFTILILYLSYKRKLSRPFVFLIICFLISFVSLRYYFGPRFYGYLNFLRPYVFIFTVFILYYLWSHKFFFGKIAATILLLLLIFLPLDRIKLETKKDPYTLEMYAIADSIKEKINRPYSIYSCPLKTYSGPYTGNVLSQTFLVDVRNSYDYNGAKIGIVHKECRLIKGSKVIDIRYNLRIVDLSNISREELKKKDWRLVTFRSAYDNYARWWFQMQP